MTTRNPTKEQDAILAEKRKYEELISWARMVASQEKPHILQEGKKHHIRFYKNDNDYWQPSELTDKNPNNDDQIDVFAIDNGYLYYIYEQREEQLFFFDIYLLILTKIQTNMVIDVVSHMLIAD